MTGRAGSCACLAKSGNPWRVALALWLTAAILVGCALPFSLPGDGAPPAVTSSPSTRPAPITAPTAISQAGDTPTVPPTLTPEPLRGVLMLWHSWNESKRPALAALIAAFRLQNPDVQFDVQYVPFDDLHARYTSAAARGGGPTLLLGPSDWGAEWFSAGLIANLGGSVPAETLEKLNPPALAGARYQQALLGVPYSQQGVLLYRNRAIIPKAPITIDDLIAFAKDGTRGDRVGALLERSFLYSGAHLVGLGGQLQSPDGSPTFSGQKGLEWIGLLRAFEQAGPTEFASDVDLELFKEGRVGLIIDGSWNLALLSQALGPGKLAIDPWPFYHSGHLSGFVFSENAYLNPNARPEDQAAAQAFLSFLLTTQAQTLLSVVGFIPTLHGVVVEDRLIAQAMIAFTDGTPYPPGRQMEIYTAQLNLALRRILYENAAPEVVLQEAQQAIVQALMESK